MELKLDQFEIRTKTSIRHLINDKQIYKIGKQTYSQFPWDSRARNRNRARLTTFAFNHFTYKHSRHKLAATDATISPTRPRSWTAARARCSRKVVHALVRDRRRGIIIVQGQAEKAASENSFFGACVSSSAPGKEKKRRRKKKPRKKKGGGARSAAEGGGGRGEGKKRMLMQPWATFTNGATRDYSIEYCETMST